MFDQTGGRRPRSPPSRALPAPFASCCARSLRSACPAGAPRLRAAASSSRRVASPAWSAWPVWSARPGWPGWPGWLARPLFSCLVCPPGLCGLCAAGSACLACPACAAGSACLACFACSAGPLPRVRRRLRVRRVRRPRRCRRHCVAWEKSLGFVTTGCPIPIWSVPPSGSWTELGSQVFAGRQRNLLTHRCGRFKIVVATTMCRNSG